MSPGSDQEYLDGFLDHYWRAVQVRLVVTPEGLDRVAATAKALIEDAQTNEVFADTTKKKGL